MMTGSTLRLSSDLIEMRSLNEELGSGILEVIALAKLASGKG
jgi:hypothetical protein